MDFDSLYNKPEKMILTNVTTGKHRNIKIMKANKLVGYGSISKICWGWLRKQQFPIKVFVTYGFYVTTKNKLEEFENEMMCYSSEDFHFALESLVRESMKGGEN